MYKSLLLAFSLLFLGSCYSLSLAPADPASSTAVNNIQIEYGSDLDGKKVAVLDRYKMKDVMAQALRQSFTMGGDTMLTVTITQFRTGGYGPTRMHAVAELTDTSGAVIKTAESDSTSMMQGVRGVGQEVVNEIAAGI